MTMIYLLYTAEILVLVGCDQILKAWTVHHLELGQSTALFPGFLRLTRVHNYGAAWSSFSGKTVLLVAVTAALLADLHSQGVAENVLAPYIQQLMTAAQTTFSPEMVEQAIAAVTEEAGAAITVLEAQLQALVQAEQAAAYYGMTLSDITITPGLVDLLYLGVKLGI